MILTLRIGIQMLLAPGGNRRKTSKQSKFFLPYRPALVAQYKLEHLTEDPKLKGS
jgi:hypothetical protein